MKESEGHTFLAVDLGAETGRVIAGNLRNFEVVHRFKNVPVKINKSLYWNVLELYQQIKTGIRNGIRHSPISVGIDTWGVDYGLLDSSLSLLSLPFHYRDERTDNVLKIVDEILSRKDLYEETGIHSLPFNTSYQLFSQCQQQPELMKAARIFLTLPDLFHFWLTGTKANEFTNASTTQLRNPNTRDWSTRVLNAVEIPISLFSEALMPGTEIGSLLPSVATEIGCNNLRVVLPPSHDTASAVAGTPILTPEKTVYISSGTWSLLGIESQRPIINELSFTYHFTNEGGADGHTRFLKNIMGLWIVQQSRLQWNTEGLSFNYTKLTEMAAAAGPAIFYIDPNDERFFKPGWSGNGMVDRIVSWCRETEQPIPKTPGEVIRGVLESLARTYADTIRHLEEITGNYYPYIHIIGGGSQNYLLCQLTANASERQVYAGPVEATALGNLMLQAIAAGDIGSIEAGRKIIHGSSHIDKYLPKNNT